MQEEDMSEGKEEEEEEEEEQCLCLISACFASEAHTGHSPLRKNKNKGLFDVKRLA